MERSASPRAIVASGRASPRRATGKPPRPPEGYFVEARGVGRHAAALHELEWATAQAARSVGKKWCARAFVPALAQLSKCIHCGGLLSRGQLQARGERHAPRVVLQATERRGRRRRRTADLTKEGRVGLIVVQVGKKPVPREAKAATAAGCGAPGTCADQLQGLGQVVQLGLYGLHLVGEVCVLLRPRLGRLWRFWRFWEWSRRIEREHRRGRGRRFTTLNRRLRPLSSQIVWRWRCARGHSRAKREPGKSAGHGGRGRQRQAQHRTTKEDETLYQKLTKLAEAALRDHRMHYR